MAATRTEHPFAPGKPPSLAEVERYLKGDAHAPESHAVERAEQGDPFMADALEGLGAPGALDALRSLDRHAPARAGRSWLWAGVAGVALVATTVLVTRERTAQPAVVDVPTAHASAPVSEAGRVLDRGTDSMLRVLHDEIDRAHPNASPAPTDAGTTERFIERDADGITYIEPRITRFEPDAASPTGPVPGHAVAHHLVYRHGLKLVHPDELYPERPPVFPAAGVPASQEDRGTNGATSTGNTVRYLDLLDEALGQYADGNTEGALDALVFLLQQYPQDVNARFYAGQCYYHLGLLVRARDQFARVLASPVDAFDEEAAWYGALVAVQVDGAAAARPLFQRIAGEGGFYADRAKAYLK